MKKGAGGHRETFSFGSPRHFPPRCLLLADRFHCPASIARRFASSPWLSEAAVGATVPLMSAPFPPKQIGRRPSKSLLSTNRMRVIVEMSGRPPAQSYKRSCVAACFYFEGLIGRPWSILQTGTLQCLTIKPGFFLCKHAV